VVFCDVDREQDHVSSRSRDSEIVVHLGIVGVVKTREQVVQGPVFESLSQNRSVYGREFESHKEFGSNSIRGISLRKMGGYGD